MKLVADPITEATGGRHVAASMSDSWPDEASDAAMLAAGDHLDAPEWMPAGSTVGRPYTWRRDFTPVVSREPTET